MKTSAHTTWTWAFVGRFATVALMVCILTAGACGSDGTPSAPSQPSTACADLEAVRQNLDKVKTSAANGDGSEADAALDDARDQLRAMRSSLGGQLQSAAAQAAADLAGAVDGLQTTMRQVRQGVGSIQGVVQQLEIQLVSAFSALSSLRGEINCDRR